MPRASASPRSIGGPRAGAGSAGGTTRSERRSARRITSCRACTERFGDLRRSQRIRAPFGSRFLDELAPWASGTFSRLAGSSAWTGTEPRGDAYEAIRSGVWIEPLARLAMLREDGHELVARGARTPGCAPRSTRVSQLAIGRSLRERRLRGSSQARSIWTTATLAPRRGGGSKR